MWFRTVSLHMFHAIFLSQSNQDGHLGVSGRIAVQIVVVHGVAIAYHHLQPKEVVNRRIAIVQEKILKQHHVPLISVSLQQMSEKVSLHISKYELSSNNNNNSLISSYQCYYCFCRELRPSRAALPPEISVLLYPNSSHTNDLFI